MRSARPHLEHIPAAHVRAEESGELKARGKRARSCTGMWGERARKFMSEQARRSPITYDLRSLSRLHYDFNDFEGRERTTASVRDAET